jgi:hypothetical protein
MGNLVARPRNIFFSLWNKKKGKYNISFIYADLKEYSTCIVPDIVIDFDLGTRQTCGTLLVFLNNK